MQDVGIKLRGARRERKWPGECAHVSPVLVERVGYRGHVARCLLCDTVGPVRESPEKAWEALWEARP